MARLVSLSFLSLVAATLVGCGHTPVTTPLSAPAPAVQAQQVAQAYLKSVQTATLTTASVVKGTGLFNRSAGFQIEGRLDDEYRTKAKLIFEGKQPWGEKVVAPSDTEIASLRPTGGRFVVELQTSSTRKPVTHVVEPSERAAFLVAVKRAMTAKPQGKNSAGQSLSVVLDLAARVIADPKAGN
jgi:hypothetical protein